MLACWWGLTLFLDPIRSRPAWCDDLKEESLSNRWLAQSGSTAVFVDEVQWDTQIPGGSGTDTGESLGSAIHAGSALAMSRSLSVILTG